MPILAVKLKNAIRAASPETAGTLEFKLRNIVINGSKRGCSGFVRNPANNAVVYVITEEPVYSTLHYMYRYADDMSDYKGYMNRWADTLDELAKNIAELLRRPVSEAHDLRI